MDSGQIRIAILNPGVEITPLRLRGWRSSAAFGEAKPKAAQISSRVAARRWKKMFPVMRLCRSLPPAMANTSPSSYPCRTVACASAAR